MLKTAVKRAMFGFMLGMAVGNLIAALTGHPNIVSPSLLQKTGSLSAALLVQTIFSGVIGAVGMGGTVLYELERWPLLATDLVHFCLIMVAFIPIASFLGWIATAKEILIMTAFMAAAHLCIFLIMCAIYRKQVKELNQMQQRFLESQQINGGNT